MMNEIIRVLTLWSAYIGSVGIIRVMTPIDRILKPQLLNYSCFETKILVLCNDDIRSMTR